MFNNLPEIHLKLLQKEQSKKTAELAGDLIGSKIADRIKNFMKISRQNSTTVTNEHDK